MQQCACNSQLCAFCSLDDANFDQASNAVQRLFAAQWQPVFDAVCPHFGLDAAAAFKQAVKCCNWGDTATGLNLWGLVGDGDDGHVQSVRTSRHGGGENGGIAVVLTPLAKFSTRQAAVAAWCRAVTA